MTESVLNKIVAARRESVAKDKQTVDQDWIRLHSKMEIPLSLSAVVKESGTSLIAEAKSTSPSLGVIRADTPLVEVVEAYEDAGASAISILTEPDFFGGSWLHLRAARAFCGLPLLCKDFIIDEFQLYMARANGADAVLLIAAALDDLELKKLIKQAHKLEMEVLTEAINKQELDRVLASQTDLIGINNRDLHTLKVNLNVSYELLEGIPHDRPIVVESGIFTRDDVERLENKGADGMLVGTALMASDNITAKVKELLGKD
ncbi:MAG: indole-3-glycerol phosphate synthase TrpC [Actinomycetota bacterium]|nr:indole-3-glycerol phosphate synthase TrpC [Actinomycetota bacterium]